MRQQQTSETKGSPTNSTNSKTKKPKKKTMTSYIYGYRKSFLSGEDEDQQATLKYPQIPTGCKLLDTRT